MTMPAPQYPVTALCSSASLPEAAKKHWREYLMEAAELGVLMFCTCLFSTLLYGAGSPLEKLALPERTKPVLMGVAVATVTFLIIRSPFGRQTGAHVNPAITLTYLWLGRIHRWDAICYMTAHFTGAVAGVLLARLALGKHLSSEPVRYVVTLPGMKGSIFAFAAELMLAAVLMGIVLFASNHRSLAPFSPLFVAMITVSFAALGSSISGFSVNPARSFSSALFAWVWQGIWIYFAAPSLGMLGAAAVFIRTMGPNSVYCAKVFHDLQSPCPFPCRFHQLYEKG
jgi:aquaporin Z